MSSPRLFTNTTRFTQSKELLHVVTLVRKLKRKEIELTIAAIDKGEGSDDQKKYAVIHALLNKLDEKIKQFNETAEPDDVETRQQEVCDFVKSLRQVTAETLGNHTEILAYHRNKNRERAQTFTQVSVITPIVMAALFTPWNFLTGAVSLLMAKGAADKSSEYSGLNDNDPESLMLCKELAEELESISNRITLNTQLGYHLA